MFKNLGAAAIFGLMLMQDLVCVSASKNRGLNWKVFEQFIIKRRTYDQDTFQAKFKGIRFYVQLSNILKHLLFLPINQHRDIVGMGSMGSDKPINFQRWVLKPIFFKEIRHILTLKDTKMG